MQQYTQIIFFVAIIAVFYFLIIRPQKKRQKDQLELMQSLVPGADIVTIGGIYGTIVSIDGDRVRIAVADGSELVIAKRAIAQVVAPAPSQVDETDDEVADETDDKTAGSDVDEKTGPAEGTDAGSEADGSDV